MKNILVIFALLTAAFAGAQKFDLTPNNFANADDKSKDFAVVEIPGKSQDELFKLAKIYLTSNYKNLKGDGYNEVEPNQIVLTLRSFSATTKLLGIPQIGGDFVNRYELNFKDGKVMIKPTFQYVEQPDGSGGLAEKDVFNSKGKLTVKQPVFEAIQNKTNEFVSDFITGISKDGSDW